MKPKTPTLPHPPDGDLVAFAQGLLVPARAAAVEVHVARCSRCAEKIADAPDDDFIGLVKAAEHSTFAAEQHRAADTRNSELKQNAAIDRLPRELRDHPRYRIEKLLAAGAMGEVYLARDVARVGRTSESVGSSMDGLGGPSYEPQPLAVKVLKPELAGNPARRKRFLQEARIAARLKHPNIAEIRDYASAGQTAYIAMEFIAGETLAQIVQRRGPLPEDEACRYVCQAAAGLAYAAGEGVIHRDIKPQNLILDPRAKLVKIIDFGLGRLIDEQRTGTRLTKEGEILGTVNYISPEQVSDARTVDIRSDIYGLGCVFFFLLCGFPPFRGRNALEVLKKQQEETPPSIVELRPDISPQIAQLIERMLAKDPEARPQTPAEIVSALDSLPSTSGKARRGYPGGEGSAGETVTDRWSVLRSALTLTLSRRARGLSLIALLCLLLSPAVLLPALTLLACLLWFFRR